MGATKRSQSIKRWAVQATAAVVLLAGGVILLQGLKWIGHRRAQNLLSQYSHMGQEGGPAPVLVLSHAGPVDFSGPSFEGWQTVSMKSPITSADTVRTGSWGNVDLALDRHVVLRVAPKSTLQFASMIRDLSNRIKLVEIAMETGQVINVVGNLKDGARFSVKTPTATVGVRGTVFMVQSTPEGTIVSTLNGTVEVTTPADPGQLLQVMAGERLEMAMTLNTATGRREIMGRYTDITPETRKQMSQAVRENAFTKPRLEGKVIHAGAKRPASAGKAPSGAREQIARERLRSSAAEKARQAQASGPTARERFKKGDAPKSMQRLSDLRRQRPTVGTAPATSPQSRSVQAGEGSSAPPTAAGPAKDSPIPSEPSAEEPVKEQEQATDEEPSEDQPVEAAADSLSAEIAIRAVLDECRDALEQLAAVPCLSRWTKPGFTLNLNGKVIPSLSRSAAELSRLITSPAVSIRDLTVTVREATAIAVFTLSVDARKAQTGDDVTRQFLVIMEFAKSADDWLAQSASAM